MTNLDLYACLTLTLIGGATMGFFLGRLTGIGHYAYKLEVRKLEHVEGIEAMKAAAAMTLKHGHPHLAGHYYFERLPKKGDDT